jgi:hypothetical protein
MDVPLQVGYACSATYPDGPGRGLWAVEPMKQLQEQADIVDAHVFDPKTTQVFGGTNLDPDHQAARWGHLSRFVSRPEECTAYVIHLFDDCWRKL